MEGKKPVRFPSDEEILDLLDDAFPIAVKKAKKNGLDLETWMLAEAICRICPEIGRCDQAKLEESVERVLAEKDGWNRA